MFVELFECVAEVCSWPTLQRVVHLLLLLLEEAQLAAQHLRATNLQEYPDLKWVILHWVSHTPDHHQKHFHALAYSELGHLFTFSQQCQYFCQW